MTETCVIMYSCLLQSEYLFSGTLDMKFLFHFPCCYLLTTEKGCFQSKGGRILNLKQTFECVWLEQSPCVFRCLHHHCCELFRLLLSHVLHGLLQILLDVFSIDLYQGYKEIGYYPFGELWVILWNFWPILKNIFSKTTGQKLFIFGLVSPQETSVSSIFSN